MPIVLEEFRGRTQTAHRISDGRGDVGAVLKLCGRLPFQGGDTAAIVIAERHVADGLRRILGLDSSTREGDIIDAQSAGKILTRREVVETDVVVAVVLNGELHRVVGGRVGVVGRTIAEHGLRERSGVGSRGTQFDNKVLGRTIIDGLGGKFQLILRVLGEMKHGRDQPVVGAGIGIAAAGGLVVPVVVGPCGTVVVPIDDGEGLKT